MSAKLDMSRSIATAYRGYQFRSRLEAKWAHFFDLCGWQWSYEPIDLPGWIPDFALGERRTLVEIKPAFELKDFSEAITKIEDSGYQGPVILLGADPTWMGLPKLRSLTNGSDGPVVGWITERMCGEVQCEWELMFGYMDGNSKLGLCAMDGAWFNYIWKADTEKLSRVCLPSRDIQTVLVDRWAKACNVAQWVPLREPIK